MYVHISNKIIAVSQFRMESLLNKSPHSFGAFQGVVHQENDTLSDLSDLSCTRYVRRNKTDLMDLTQAMYLSVQGTNSLHKAVQTLYDIRHRRLVPDIAILFWLSRQISGNFRWFQNYLFISCCTLLQSQMKLHERLPIGLQCHCHEPSP
jgi:hypothetical protein